MFDGLIGLGNTNPSFFFFFFVNVFNSKDKNAYFYKIRLFKKIKYYNTFFITLIIEKRYFH